MAADGQAAGGRDLGRSPGLRRREPWPFVLAALLLFMIAVCVAFYAVAASHPDRPLDLERAGLRPYEGYVARGAAEPAEARR